MKKQSIDKKKFIESILEKAQCDTFKDGTSKNTFILGTKNDTGRFKKISTLEFYNATKRKPYTIKYNSNDTIEGLEFIFINEIRNFDLGDKDLLLVFNNGKDKREFNFSI